MAGFRAVAVGQPRGKLVHPSSYGNLSQDILDKVAELEAFYKANAVGSWRVQVFMHSNGYRVTSTVSDKRDADARDAHFGPSQDISNLR